MKSLCRQTDNGKTICIFRLGALKKKGKKLAKIQVKITEFGLRVGMMVQKHVQSFKAIACAVTEIMTVVHPKH